MSRQQSYKGASVLCLEWNLWRGDGVAGDGSGTTTAVEAVVAADVKAAQLQRLVCAWFGVEHVEGALGCGGRQPAMSDTTTAVEAVMIADMKATQLQRWVRSLL